MKLNIQPLIALCDKKIDITITDLPPYSSVKVSASMCLPWAKNVLYESYAWFVADSEGNVNLSEQKPESGTYDFADSMGLIVSMRSNDEKALDKIAQNISVKESQFIHITAEYERDKISVVLERKFMKEDVKCQKIWDEFVGEWYYTENSNNQTIIWLGGSGSCLAVNSPIASVLASHGFNVLSIAYFNEKGLPSQLSEVPIDYFEKVFNWMKSNTQINEKEIYLLGMSKGAELSLILASRYPNITKVAVLAPHAYCFQGIGFKNVSSWTYKGKQLPYVRLKNSWLFADMLSCMIRKKAFGFTHTYKKGLENAQNRDLARIHVEDINADILMFTGRNNNMWNSYDGCKEIMRTLKENSYSKLYDLVVYEDAGESFFVPYVIPACESKKKIAPRLVLSTGGTMQGNAYAQKDSWEKIIVFFKSKL